MAFLQIKDLHVRVEGKEILKGLNLTVEKGTVHAIMGPNGSGKSTLSNAIMGHPRYEVTSGDILLEGESILKMKPDERARKGLFLSFQYPEEIEGVTISNFLRTAVNSVRGEKDKLSVLKFKEAVKEKMKLLMMSPDFLSRYLNKGFSGGEKKRAEILQLLMLNPGLAVLDETDSGLDIDALKVVSEGVNSFMKKGSHASHEKSVLIITHYKRILNYVKPDKVSILIDGRIALEGKGDLVDHLEDKGYGWIVEEQAKK
ncbi:Fe-S cluster assembly ATPase SufC [Candidatus Woesearchaeota archaeon]|nr:Fe-S cluster assembly ATPase SufC [Candidatus Woesearchaeota archaeon]